MRERGYGQQGEKMRWGKAVLICLLLLGWGCARIGYKSSSGSGPVVSRTVSMHSEVFGSPWGSLASYPQLFREPMVLWNSETEPRQVNADASAVVVSEIFMDQWLPRGESETMRRFMRSLGDGRGPPSSTLNRIHRDLPMIQEVLMDYGLPLELAFLPVVESSFEPWAMSPAGAAGLWQLMPGTAQRFGLKVSENEDERFDKRRSTAAAAAYLVELHKLFRDWPLALAAYNCGEGALARALVRTGTGTLSELTAACRGDRDFFGLLSGETLDYVPRFVGAVKVLSALIGLEGLICSADGPSRESDPEAHSRVSPQGEASRLDRVAIRTASTADEASTP